MVEKEKMEQLYLLIYGDTSLSSFSVGKERDKKIRNGILKIYHPDYFDNYSKEEQEKYLNYFYTAFRDFFRSGDLQEDAATVIRFITNSDKPILDQSNSVKEEPKDEKWALEFTKKRFADLKGKFPSYSERVDSAYQKFSKSIHDNSSVDDILANNSKYYELVYNFITKSEEYRNSLSNLLEELKGVLNLKNLNDKYTYDKLVNQVGTFQKSLFSSKGNLRIKNLTNVENAFFPIYAELKKTIILRQFWQRTQWITKPAYDFFKPMLEQCYEAIQNADIAQYTKKTQKADKNSMAPEKQFDEQLSYIVGHFEVQLYRKRDMVGYYQKLKNMVEQRGYREEEVGVDFSSLFSCSNVEECKERFEKLESILDLELGKLDTIKELNQKCLSLPDSVVLKNRDKFIREIQESVSSFSLVSAKVSIFKKVDYFVYINSKIDEYIQEISQDPQYSFVVSDIKRAMEKIRVWYDPEKFDKKFEGIKSDFFNIAKEANKRAQEKKQGLSERMAYLFAKGAFLEEHRDSVLSKIHSVDTFGGFSGLENKIIIEELGYVVDEVIRYLNQELEVRMGQKYFESYVDRAMMLLDNIKLFLSTNPDLSKPNSKIWGISYPKLFRDIRRFGVEDSSNFFIQPDDSVLVRLEKSYQKYCEQDKRKSGTVKR